MMEFEIVPGRAEHAEEILEIRSVVRADTYANDNNGTTKDFYIERNRPTDERIGKEVLDLLDPAKQYWIAEVGDKIAGYSRVIKGERQSLDMIHILPQYQGRGLGSHLLNLACASFDRTRPAFLEVVDINYRALGWYANRGWKLTGETKNGTPLPDGSGYVPEYVMVLAPTEAEDPS